MLRPVRCRKWVITPKKKGFNAKGWRAAGSGDRKGLGERRRNMHRSTTTHNASLA